MPILSLAERGKVIIWRSEGVSLGEIVRRFRELGVHVSKWAVSKCVRRYEETGSVADRQRSGRPSVLTEEEMRFIDALIEEDNELSSIAIRDKLRQRFEKVVGVSTIRRVRQQIGWTRTKAMYGQLIRNHNKAARLAFAVRMHEINEQFHDIIYTDESTFWVENNARHYYRRVGTANKKVGKPKHPYKVHVWGGVSRRGTTRLAIFEGIMRKEFFTDVLLQQFLLPFIREAYPDGCRLMMDNDPKHCSKYAMDFMRHHNIRWWRTPAESPDANPIEHIWGNMKVFIRRHVKPRTKEQLITGLKEYWQTKLTSDRVKRHLDNVYHVYPEIITQRGDRTKY